MNKTFGLIMIVIGLFSALGLVLYALCLGVFTQLVLLYVVLGTVFNAWVIHTGIKWL